MHVALGKSTARSSGLWLICCSIGLHGCKLRLVPKKRNSGSVVRAEASQVRDGKHVHEFNLKDVSDGFNTSHIIHRLEWPAQCGLSCEFSHKAMCMTLTPVVSGSCDFRFGQRVPGVESPLEVQMS